MQNDVMGHAVSVIAGEQSPTAVGSGRLAGVLALLLVVPVAVFFWFAAYHPADLAVPIGPSGPTSIWIVYGVGLIGYATALNGLYVVLTNRRGARPTLRAPGRP